MSIETVTLSIRVDGETREVEFAGIEGGRFVTSPSIFAARIGNGRKLHRTLVKAAKFESVEDAQAKGWRASQLQTVEGTVYAVAMTATIRNSIAAIVAWADTYKGTDTATAQVYYGSL